MKTACRNNSHTQLGFTLIELVVTVSIVAILATVAVPNFRTFILNNRIKSTSQVLLRAFQTARSEAIKRQENVVICLSRNPTSGSSAKCFNDPNSPAGAITGWIIFNDLPQIDSSGNTVKPDWQKNASEQIIGFNTVESSKVNLAPLNQSFSYTPSGYANFNSTAPITNTYTAIVVCDNRGNVDGNGGTTGPSVARALRISTTGLAQLSSNRTHINLLCPQ